MAKQPNFDIMALCDADGPDEKTPSGSWAKKSKRNKQMKMSSIEYIRKLLAENKRRVYEEPDLDEREYEEWTLKHTAPRS